MFQNTNYRMEGPGFNALFGPSGVGKTTLAKIIAGETTSFTGSLDKKDISRILYTYNLERLPNWSSIGDHLSAIAPASKKKALEEWIEIFGLGSGDSLAILPAVPGPAEPGQPHPVSGSGF